MHATIPYSCDNQQVAFMLRLRLISEVCKDTRGDYCTIVYDENNGTGWYVIIHTLNIQGMIYDLKENSFI